MNRSRAPLYALALAVAFGATAWSGVAQGQAGRLTLENLWTIRTVSEPKWSPDGSRIAFIVSEPEKNASVLMVSDREGHLRRLTGAASGDSQATRQEVASLVGLLPAPWTPDGSALLYQSQGKLLRVDVTSGRSRVLLDLGGRSKGYTPQVYFNGPDPVLSPDGKRLAFIRESEVYVLELVEGGLRKLTATHPAGWHNMLPRWSPDGTKLLYTAQRVDEQRPFAFPDFAKQVIDVSFSLIGYGRVRVGVVSADGGETKWLGEPEGIKYSLRGGSGAWWSPDGASVALNRVSLDHKSREILVASPETGKTRSVFKEAVDRWISPHAIWVRWSPDSSRLLFTSERDGWNHVYVAPAAGGEPRQVTSGSFAVTSNQVYDNSETTPDWSPDGQRIYFTSSEAGSAERHLYAVPVAGGDRTRVTTLSGLDMSATLSPDASHVAYLHSDLTTLPELYVQPTSGGKPFRLTSLATPPALEGHTWAEAQIVQYPNTKDGKMVAARLYAPEPRVRGRRYPAVVYVHGGGYVQSVFRGWSGADRTAFNHFLLQKGYVVLDVDYRGSAGYGRQFREDVFDRMADVDLEDVSSGVEYLKKLGYVDPARIGIWGHSYGGFMVCAAMFRAPLTFAAGVSGAPVTDWERFFYLAPGYNEEHLGFPWENPEGTKRASPLTYAGDLKRPMLILSGIQDTMHLDSAALVNVLVEKGLPVEWLFYPNEPHGFRQPQAKQDYYRRTAEFLDRYLMPRPSGPVH